MLRVCWPQPGHTVCASQGNRGNAHYRTVVVVNFVQEKQPSLGWIQWQQPGGSWAFTAPCLALTHCTIQSPDRIFTLLWAPHHCESELIWIAFRISSASMSELFAFVPVSEVLQVNWDRWGNRTCQGEFSSSSSSSSPSPLFHPVFDFPTTSPVLFHQVYKISAPPALSQT